MKLEEKAKPVIADNIVIISVEQALQGDSRTQKQSRLELIKPKAFLNAILTSSSSAGHILFHMVGTSRQLSLFLSLGLAGKTLISIPDTRPNKGARALIKLSKRSQSDIESVTGLTPLTNAHLTFNNGAGCHRVTSGRGGAK